MEKECSICGNLFESKAWNAKYCNKCKIIKEREWKKKAHYNNRDEILKKRRDYYRKNKEKHKKRIIKYREDNREKCLERQKQHYYENREKYKKLNKIRYKKNREDILKQQRDYYNKTINERRKQKREYNKRPEVKERRNKNRNKRRKEDHLYRLMHNLTCGIRDYMKLNDIAKTKKSYEYIGCSPEYLKNHLEKQFNPGMTWDNYGSYWHVDHIVPISSAKTEEDIYKLNHYLNLQPLEADLNLSKGAKIPEQLPIYIF